MTNRKSNWTRNLQKKQSSNVLYFHRRPEMKPQDDLFDKFWSYKSNEDPGIGPRLYMLYEYFLDKTLRTNGCIELEVGYQNIAEQLVSKAPRDAFLVREMLALAYENGSILYGNDGEIVFLKVIGEVRTLTPSGQRMHKKRKKDAESNIIKHKMRKCHNVTHEERDLLIHTNSVQSEHYEDKIERHNVTQNDDSKYNFKNNIYIDFVDKKNGVINTPNEQPKNCTAFNNKKKEEMMYDSRPKESVDFPIRSQDGSFYTEGYLDIEYYEKTMPNLNVVEELRKFAQYLHENPEKQSVLGHMKKKISTYLRKKEYEQKLRNKEIENDRRNNEQQSTGQQPSSTEGHEEDFSYRRFKKKLLPWQEVIVGGHHLYSDEELQKAGVLEGY